MILYLDTSSLVKLYVEESGSAHVRKLLEAATVVATSIVAYAESRSALARQRREGGITITGHTRIKSELDQDWERLLVLAVTQSISRRAGDLAEKHRLRGFDSLHLASYLTLRDQGRDQRVQFSAFDSALNRAARIEASAG